MPVPAALAAMAPEALAMAKDMAAKPDIPIYETDWIDENGQSHRIAVTPRAILFVGGGALLLAVAAILWKIREEADGSFLGGGPGLFSLLSLGVGGATGAPFEIISDLAKGGGGASVFGNIVKYSSPITLAADWAGVPVDETAEKAAKKIKGWFT